MATPSPLLTAGTSLSFDIAREPDTLPAKRAARDLAARWGFRLLDEEEILLVVSELASNLVKHSHGGRLTLKLIDAGERKGLEIETVDSGPGIADPESALRDGYSTAGSLGYGLGTINRLMDEMEISSASGAGTRVTCLRWVRETGKSLAATGLEFGVATRARGGAEENGDAYVVKKWENFALAAVIDGLGHGPYAARAAQAAKNYIDAHFDQSLENILRGADRACRSTRGVVIGLARIAAPAKLSFVGVGNVEAYIIGDGRSIATISQRGIVGSRMPVSTVTEYPWGPGHLLVMHSDGVKSHWQWNDFPGLIQEGAQFIAHRLLSTLARPEDDATVLIVKSRSA